MKKFAYGFTAIILSLSLSGCFELGKDDEVDVGKGEPPLTGSVDADGDGITDNNDNCINTSNADQANYDGDSEGDVCDSDDDNDGVADGEDVFPLDETETHDFDGDGVGDNADADDDNDGFADTVDAFPYDDAEYNDHDGDGVGDNADSDDDNDGYADSTDAFPFDDSEYNDHDGDGVGDNADTDDDNDGVSDANDEFPLDENESKDTDGDGIGNNADSDDDNDGVADSEDAFPEDDSETADLDNDGVGDNSDPDRDGDSVNNDDDAFPNDPDRSQVSGGGVKGPMAFATVSLYQIDYNAEDFKGTLIDTGETNAQAQITGISVGASSPPYLLIIEDDDDTIDITTGQEPVITIVKTVITQAMLDNGTGWYATPLSTMAVNIALANSSNDTELLVNLPAAASQVKSTLGFGAGANVDIYSTPPLLDESTGDTEDQVATTKYRSAVEALTAVVFQMNALNNTNEGEDTSPDSVLASLSADLSDGIIDGSSSGENSGYAVETLEVLGQDPATLPIPNDPENRTVAQVKSVIVAETSTTGNDNDTTVLASDETVIEVQIAETNPDKDRDGVLNSEDAFPEDASADSDYDGDGVPDVAFFLDGDGNRAGENSALSDDDDDNDGVNDEDDLFPLNELEYADTDLDGIGNNEDDDDDGDSVLDVDDLFPLNDTESADNDLDGIGDNADPDDDNDGVGDVADAFPNDPNEFADFDGDGVGNNADTDDDNDGVLDAEDDFPLNADLQDATDLDNDGWPSEQDPDDNDNTNPGTAFVDTDLDSIGDAIDEDDDNDGVLDADDAFPLDRTEYSDLDGDGIGDNTDTDIDGDGVANSNDAFPRNNAESVDSDGDGIGNVADTDDDNDGVRDINDAFPLDSQEQKDFDSDGVGNRADTDDDDDGVLDTLDRFPFNAAESADFDHDGVGNNSDKDDDNDGLTDEYENSIGTNPFDIDSDDDGVLDRTDAFPLDPNFSFDSDKDGVANFDVDGNVVDNCPLRPNPSQADFDGDLRGDACDADDDNDGVRDAEDAFPYDETESADNDGDGIGNNADDDDDNDGVLDIDDAFVFDASEYLDTDNDGVGNNTDTDDDGDGISDSEDLFPLDATESGDNDGDGEGNAIDNDDDNDGVEDSSDAFPLDKNEQFDTDNDGIGNNADTDDDGDGVDDVNDDFPLDPQRQDASDQDQDGWPSEQDPDDTDATNPGTPFVDSDLDGLGDELDSDDDNDGVLDIVDAFPNDPAEHRDTDQDGIGDNSDTDIDGDGVVNEEDLFPRNPLESKDFDMDGIGDNNDFDDDNDGVSDLRDAFPNDPNETNDLDQDGIGDRADTDIDGDGVENELDAFPYSPSEAFDSDNDGLGNNIDNDDDNDGVADDRDAFPEDPTEFSDLDQDGIGDNSDDDIDGDGVPNDEDALPRDPAEGKDTDGDGLGDNTDADDDGDGLHDQAEIVKGTDPLNPDTDSDNFFDGVDNCPLVANPDQFDFDFDFIGDACDDDIDGDGMSNDDDPNPTDPTNGEGAKDFDNDGIPDINDTDIDNDGVPNEEDVDPYNPNVWQEDQLLDLDGDGVSDFEDNCVVIANENQLDTDENGLGDVCDVMVSDISGLWHGKGMESFSSVSADMVCEFDGQSKSMGGLGEIEMSGNQFFVFDAKINGDDEYVDDYQMDMKSHLIAYGVLNADGSYEWYEILMGGDNHGDDHGGDQPDDGMGDGMTDGPDAMNDDGPMMPMLHMYMGQYDSVSDTLSHGDSMEEGNCVVTTDWLIERPDPNINEETQFMAGLSWFSGNYDWFEYGRIEDVLEGADETFYVYDYETAGWVAEMDMGMEWVITDSGLAEVDDTLMVTGYGTDGEVAMLSNGVADFNVELMGLDIAGQAIGDYLPPSYRWYLDDMAMFSDLAVSYVATIESSSAFYGFWCDDEYLGDMLPELNCQNAVIIDWVFDDSTADGQTMPVVAMSIDDVVNNATDMGTMAPVQIWLGHEHSAEIWSDDGTFAGANLEVKYFNHLNLQAGPVVVSGGIEVSVMGDVTVYEFVLPEGAEMMSEMMFLFEESTLESTDTETKTMLRMGYHRSGTDVEQMMLFNDVAKDDVLMHFEPMLPVDDDWDNDGWKNWEDNCPDHYNPEQHDIDGNGVGDACDFHHEDKDYDQDGWLDGEDNCPVFWNEDQLDVDENGIGDACEIDGEMDTDGDGVVDALDDDIDGDGVLNDEDLDAHNPWIGKEIIDPDFDGDGIPDYMDDDIDGDGVHNEDDYNPYDPTIWDGGQLSDLDGDGVSDFEDNCVVIANENQLDTDENGLGDVCDVMVSDISGLWHGIGMESFSSVSADMVCEFDGQSKPMGGLGEIEMSGNQFFVFDAKINGDDEYVDDYQMDMKSHLIAYGVLNADGSYEWYEILMGHGGDHGGDQPDDGMGDGMGDGSGDMGDGMTDGPDAMNDDGPMMPMVHMYMGQYDSVSDTLSHGDSMEEGNCVVTTDWLIERPDPNINEETQFMAGLSWFSGNYDWFEYGRIEDVLEGADETFYVYDYETAGWVAEMDMGMEWVITDSGLAEVDDTLMVTGYGTDGEVAMLSNGVADFNVELMGLDIAGQAIGDYLPPSYRWYLDDMAMFSDLAVSYVATIESSSAFYGFWCDDEYLGDMLPELNCQNAVIIDWVFDDSTADGQTMPVVAMSIDDVVNNATDMGTMAPVQIWLGHEHSAEIWSDDGTFAGANLEVKYFNHLNLQAGPVVVSGGIEVSVMGDVTVYEFVLPEGAEMMSEMMFLFEESTLESTDTETKTMLRMGYHRSGMDVEQMMLFNDVAKDDVLMHFEPMLPVDDDWDNDGWKNWEDNCPDHYNPEQHDIDGNGVGDACDFHHEDKDYDQDGWLDGEDNCPVFWNEDQLDVDANGVGDACEIDGEMDTDGDGVVDALDDDIDGDGVLNDEDLDAHNPWIGKDIIDPDFDGDGIPDYMDDDIDGDGVHNEDDYNPYDPTIWDGGQLSDLDGDGVSDFEDNCVVIANENQLDTDENGLGDVCDVMVSDISGLWHGIGMESFSSVSADMVCEFDGQSKSMGGLGEIEMSGNQFFVFDAKINGDDEYVDDYQMDMKSHLIAYGVLNADGSYEWYEILMDHGGDQPDDGMGDGMTDGPDAMNDGPMMPMVHMYMGQYDSVSDTLSHGDSMEEGNCVVTTDWLIERPDPNINEETQFMAGLSWFSDNYDWFEYGRIEDVLEGADETFYVYDYETAGWVAEMDMGMEWVITDSGLAEVDDTLMVTGYGTDGEVAMLSNGVADFNVELMGLDIAGQAIGDYLPPSYRWYLDDMAMFSDLAVSYVATIESSSEFYGFWCDDEYLGDMLPELNCQNAVIIDWVFDDSTADGQTMPVVAMSIDDVVNNATDMGTMAPVQIWLGHEHSAEIWSDDGTFAGANLEVKYFNHLNLQAGPVVVSGGIEVSVMGDVTVYEFVLPEGAEMMSEMMFLFEESTLESTDTETKTMLRMGYHRSGTDVEQMMLFNDVAKDDVLMHFEPMLPVDDDWDNDGWKNWEDNCPDHYNPEQHDIDGNGIGDACDFHHENKDYDQDGWLDGEDNCPVFWNEDQLDVDANGVGDACEIDGEMDTDGDGVVDALDDDIDGDGVLNDEDLDAHNPWIGKDIIDPDFDGDGIPDYMDDDIDGDGVHNEDDYNPYDPTIWDGGQLSDLDGDGVSDFEDNCVVIANENQLDTDENGLGDVCDVMVSDISGLWHGIGMESFSSVSADMVCEFDGQSKSMGGLGEIEMSGNQFFVFDAKINGDDEYVDDYQMDMKSHLIAYGVLNADGSYEWYEILMDHGGDQPDDGMGDGMTDGPMMPMVHMYMGQYDSVSDTLSHGDSMEEGNCVVTTDWLIERPDPNINEETQFMAGLSWFSDNYDWFEYGRIEDVLEGADETFYVYDYETAGWVAEMDMGMEWVITDSGLAEVDDTLMVTGYGTDGEVAMLSNGVADFNVELMGLDIAGQAIGDYLPPSYRWYLDDMAMFSDLAVSYVATIESSSEFYGFWCDDEYLGDMLPELNCQNAVIIDWVFDDSTADGQTMPVVAMSIDDVVNNATDMGTMAPVQIWLGHEHSAEIWSDDGTFAGANLEVKYFNHLNLQAGPVVVSGGIEVSVMGDVTVYEFVLPEGAEMMSEMMFLFEESTLESTDTETKTMLRMGYHRSGTDVEQMMLFNDVAKDDVLMHFEPMLPVDDDWDNDGWKNWEDNCPDHYNPEQHDIDGNGVGDACDFHHENKDYDQDGWLDGEDNCPVFWNEDQLDVDANGVGDACEIDGEMDTDGDGVVDALDDDIDGDGVLNDEDLDAHNPWIGKDIIDPDFDGDGIPDYMDDDIDGDGVHNEDDYNPYDPTIWDGGQLSDLDGDGVSDFEDNCVVIANENQLDTDENGLGDVCDVMVSDISGLWHGIGMESFSSVSADMVCEFDGQSKSMGGLGEIEMSGNQFFVFDAKINGDDEYVDDYQMDMKSHLIAYGVLNADGSYEWYEILMGHDDDHGGDQPDDGMGDGMTDGPDAMNDDGPMMPMVHMYMGQYDSVSDTLSHGDSMEEGNCVVTTDWLIERPDPNINEETQFMAGLSWFNSFYYDGMVDYEYGEIIDGASSNDESLFKYDAQLEQWTQHTDMNMDEYLVTDAGIMLSSGIVEVTGYDVDGETAMVSVDGMPLTVDLHGIDLSGAMISDYLNYDYQMALEGAVFSDLAVGYVSMAVHLDNAYRLSCGHDPDMEQLLDLECANAVILDWQESESGDAIPVVATSIDDMIANASIADDSEYHIYFEGDIFAVIESDDGTAAGANLTVSVYQHSYSDTGEQTSEMLGSGALLATTIGSHVLYQLQLPGDLPISYEHADNMFYVAETQIESDNRMVLRRGHMMPAGEEEQFLMFNTVAKDDILLNFEYPVANMTMDFDNDGIVDSDDNCIDVVNSDQADFNLDGSGDACTDTDGDGFLDSEEIANGSDPNDINSVPAN